MLYKGYYSCLCIDNKKAVNFGCSDGGSGKPLLIHASENLTAVFGGNGNVVMKATNIVRESESVPVFDPDLTVAKMVTDEF